MYTGRLFVYSLTEELGNPHDGSPSNLSSRMEKEQKEGRLGCGPVFERVSEYLIESTYLFES